MQPFAKRRLGRTGLQLTALGFGGAPLGELFVRIPEAEAQECLDAAYGSGVRYFDTAPWYGNTLSEHRTGHFLRQKPRGKFAISTKVGRIFQRPSNPDSFDHSKWIGGLNFELRFDYSYDGIMRSYEDSLQRLGLPRVQALFIHDLDVGHHGQEGVDRYLDQLDHNGGFRALEELKRSGEIKAIGVGVNEHDVMLRFLDRFDLDAFIVPMPYTLLDQDSLDGFFPKCAERGVGIVIGAPYASGILATGAIPGAKYGYQDASPEIVERVSRIGTVCNGHDVPLRAAALQFPLFHPIVASVIPGAISPAQVIDNVAMISHSIPRDFWMELKQQGLIRQDAPTAD